MNFLKINLTLYFLFSTLFCQFGVVDVEIDLTQIRESEKLFVKLLPDDIKSYLENVVYSTESEDLELEILIKIILEHVPRNGNERAISAQILFTNYMDQTYFSRSVRFNYSNGMNLSYSSTFHSLRSLLDFYGLLFVGSEMDIWKQYGGEIYFFKSEEIAKLGKESDYSEGWDTKKNYIEDVILFKEFRNAKFVFFQALDNIYMEDNLPESQIKFLKDFYNASMDIPDLIMEFKYTRNFFKVYSEEIAKNFVKYKLIDELKEFQYLDPDNKDIYKKYIIE